MRAASAQPGYNKECATLRAVAVPAQVELETSVTNKAIKERCASGEIHIMHSQVKLIVTVPPSSP